MCRAGFLLFRPLASRAFRAFRALDLRVALFENRIGKLGSLQGEPQVVRWITSRGSLPGGLDTSHDVGEGQCARRVFSLRSIVRVGELKRTVNPLPSG